MKNITLTFQNEDGLVVTLQGNDWNKIKQAIGEYDPKGINVNGPELVPHKNNSKPVTK